MEEVEKRKIELKKYNEDLPLILIFSLQQVFGTDEVLENPGLSFLPDFSSFSELSAGIGLFYWRRPVSTEYFLKLYFPGSINVIKEGIDESISFPIAEHLKIGTKIYSSGGNEQYIFFGVGAGIEVYFWGDDMLHAPTGEEILLTRGSWIYPYIEFTLNIFIFLDFNVSFTPGLNKTAFEFQLSIPLIKKF